MQPNQPESEEPNPPRLWWTKRLCILAAAMTVLYLGGFLLWKHEANQRLQEAIDAIHSRGEPILAEDFKFEIVPDELNAVTSVQAAAAVETLLPATLQTFLDNFDPYKEIDALSRARMGQIVSLIQPALMHARVSRFQNRVDWGLRIQASVQWAFIGQSLSGVRSLGRALGLTVLEQHLAGNDAEAVETIRDMLRVAEVCDEQNPSIVAHLVASSMSQEAAKAAHRICSDLNLLNNVTSTTQPTGPASRQQVQVLIQELLDESKSSRGLPDWIDINRAWYHDALTNNAPRAFGLPSLPFAPLWQPFLNLQSAVLLEQTGRARTATTLPTYPQALAIVQSLESDTGEVFTHKTPATILTHFGPRLTMGYSRFFAAHFHALAERRAQAIALAIRLYQKDHANEYPGKLSDLTQRYLQAIPLDPFSAVPRPFAYRASPTPMLISVGEDGKDDDGDLSLPPGLNSRGNPQIPPGHTNDADRNRRRDLITLLGNPKLIGVPQDKPSNDSTEDSEPSPQSPATQPAEPPVQ